MENTAANINNNPESYSPSTPVILNMAEMICTEKIVETILIDDVSF